jgi:hypothetical protein
MGRPKKEQASSVELDAELAPVENNEHPSNVYNKELVATLKKYPHIHCVFVDDEGNWHFAEKPGFYPVSREDILNG